MKPAEEQYYDHQAEQDADLTASALQQSFARASRYYRALLGPHLPSPTASPRILDVACGRGNNLFFLREMGFRDVVGVDTNPKRIALAKELGLDAREADAFGWLAENEDSYDVITALDFLEHLPKEASLEFLTLCGKSLRPGGQLIVRTACADGPFGAASRYNDFTHHQAFTSGLLRELLKMKGFQRVTILGETPQPYNLLNALRRAVFAVAKPVATVALASLGLGTPAVWSRDMWGIGYKS